MKYLLSILVTVLAFDLLAKDLCTGSPTGKNPYEYSLCKPVHSPSPTQIKQAKDIHQRYRLHLKKQAVTPGTELHHLLSAMTSGIALTNQEISELSKLSRLKAYHHALTDEISGIAESGIVDATALGLSEEAAVTIATMSTAAAPEIVVPVVAVMLGAAFGETIIEGESNTLASCSNCSFPFSTGVTQSVINAEELAEFFNLKGAHKTTSKIHGVLVTEILQGIPVRCKFPIIKHKLYFNQLPTNFDLQPAFTRLKAALPNHLYQKALRNFTPPNGMDQYCDYLHPNDKQSPYHPNLNIIPQTLLDKRLAAIVRPITVTRNNTGQIQSINFGQDQLYLKNSVSFADSERNNRNYRLHAGLQILDNTLGKGYFSYRGSEDTFPVDTVTISAGHPITTLNTEIQFYYHSDMMNFVDPRARVRWTAAALGGWITQYSRIYQRPLMLGDILNGYELDHTHQLADKLKTLTTAWFSDNPRIEDDLVYRSRNARILQLHSQQYINDLFTGIAMLLEFFELSDIKLSSIELLFAQAANNATHPSYYEDTIAMPEKLLDIKTATQNLGFFSLVSLFESLNDYNRSQLDWDTRFRACSVTIPTNSELTLRWTSAANTSQATPLTLSSIIARIHEYVGNNCFPTSLEIFKSKKVYFRHLTINYNAHPITPLSDGDALSVTINGYNVATLRQLPNQLNYHINHYNNTYLMKLKYDDEISLQAVTQTLKDKFLENLRNIQIHVLIDEGEKQSL